MNTHCVPLHLVMGVLIVLFAGCADPTSPARPASEPTSIGHAHPTLGPHDGRLIELGNEEYHAELVPAAEKVTIYVLDARVEEAVAIAESDIILNATINGRPRQFKLSASPEQKDKPGESSRFESVDEDLTKHVNGGDARVQLVLKIAGKPYRGRLDE